MTKFKGFSTKTKRRISEFGLTDIDLIKQDLLNMFNCRVTERVFRPNHGCRIWEVIFDPFDEQTRAFVVEEVLRIISLEPRVEIADLAVSEFEHGIRIHCSLRINSLTTTETLNIIFNRDLNIAQLV